MMAECHDSPKSPLNKDTSIVMRQDDGGHDDDDEQQLLPGAGGNNNDQQQQQQQQPQQRKQRINPSPPSSPLRRLLGKVSISTSLHSKSFNYNNSIADNQKSQQPRSPRPRRRRSLLGSLSVGLHSASTPDAYTRCSGHENEVEHDDENSNHDDNNNEDGENYHDEQRQILQQYCQQQQQPDDDDDMQEDVPPQPAFFAPSLQLDASKEDEPPPPSPAAPAAPVEVLVPPEAPPPSSPTRKHKPTVRRRSLFFGALSSSIHETAAAATTPDEKNDDDDARLEESVPAAPPRPTRRRSIFGVTSLLPSSIHGTTAVTPPPNHNNDDARQEESVPAAAAAAAPPRPARRRSIFGGAALLSSSIHGTAAVTPPNNDSDDERQQESVPAVAPPRPARRRSIFGGAALLSSSIHGTGVTPNNDDERKESSAAPPRPARRRSIFGGMAIAFNRATSGANNEIEEENNGNNNIGGAVAPGTATGDNTSSNHQEQVPEEDYPFIYILKPASCANNELDNAHRHPALLPKPAKGRFRNTMKRERSNRKLGGSNRSNSNNKNNEQSFRSLGEDVSSTREMNRRPMSESMTTRPPEDNNVAGGNSDENSHHHCPITNKVMDRPEPRSSSILEAPPRPGKGRVRKAILKSLAFRPWKRKLLKDDDDGDDPKANGQRRNSMTRRRSLHKSSKSPEPQPQEQLCLSTALSSPKPPIQECREMAQQQLGQEKAQIQSEEGQDTKCLDVPSVEEDTVTCFNRSFDGLECYKDDDDDGCLVAASLFNEEDIVENENGFNPLEYFADDDCLDAESFEEETVENEKSVTTLEEYDDEIEEVTVKSGSIIEYDEETIVEEVERSLKSLEYEEEELVDFDQEDVFVVSPNGRVRDREGKVIGFSENEWGTSSLQPPPLGNQTLPSLSPHCRGVPSPEGQEPVLQLDLSTRVGTSVVSNEGDSDADTHEVISEDSESHLQFDPAVVACDSPCTKIVSNEGVNNIDNRHNESVNTRGNPLSAPPSLSWNTHLRNIIGSEMVLSPEQPLPQASKREEHSAEQAFESDDEAIPSPSNKANRFNEIFRGLKALSPTREGNSKSINHMESPMSHAHSEPIEGQMGPEPNQQEFQSDDEAPPSPTNKANRFHEIFKGLMMPPSPRWERADCSTSVTLHQDGNVTSTLRAAPLSNLEELQLQSPPFCANLDMPVNAAKKEVETKLPHTQRKPQSSARRMPTPTRQRKTGSRQAGSLPRKRQSGTRAAGKGVVGDPIRWDLRVRFGSPVREVYNKPLRHDDCVLVPDFFGPTSDWAIYYKLLEEIQKLQEINNTGSNLIPCPQDVGKHLVCPTPMKSKTFKEVCKKVCKYFDIKLETVQFTLNWYRDNTDMQKPRHDEEAYENDKPSIRNITVGISFGAERELSLEKHDALDRNKLGAHISIPQCNNCVCTIGRDVNIRFKNGLVQAENDIGGGSIAIILWGQVQNVKEEKGSPAQLKRDPQYLSCSE